MKKILIIIIFTTLAISELAFAAGKSDKGTVRITTSGNLVYLQGALNVRFNEDAAETSYIGIFGKAKSTILFSAGDDDGDVFSCNIRPTHPRYQEAVDIRNGAKNGSFLYAVKKITSNSCEDFSLSNFSYYLD